MSAFLFSTIAHITYVGNTSALLKFLALGTALPMVIGCFFVRTIPLPSPDYLSQSILQQEHVPTTPEAVTTVSGRLCVRSPDDAELAVSEHRLIDSPREDTPLLGRATFPDRHHENYDEGFPNIFGKDLWQSVDFWLLFTILSIRAYLLPFDLPCISYLKPLWRAFIIYHHFSMRDWISVQVPLKPSDCIRAWSSNQLCSIVYL